MSTSSAFHALYPAKSLFHLAGIETCRISQSFSLNHDLVWGLQAFKDVFDTLDKADAILDKQRYVVGNQLTEADIRFFVTLIRFDEVGCS